MLESKNKNNLVFNYNKYEINIFIKGHINVLVDLESVSLYTLNIILKRKKHLDINLGDLYARLPKTINERIEKTLSKKIINEIDDITFNKYRYLGNYTEDIIDEDKLIESLKDKLITKEDINLGNIYSEFLELNEVNNKKEYRNYSCFLEFYLHGKTSIPDIMKKIYLERNNKTILETDNIDSEIRKTFSGNMYTSHEKDINKNVGNIKDIEIELISNEKDLDLIEQFIKALNLIDKLDVIVKKLEDDLYKMFIKEERIPKIFIISKKNIKNKILKNIKNYKKALETKDECYDSLKKDISISFPKLKIKDLNSRELLDKLKNYNRSLLLNKGKVINKKQSLQEKNEELRKDELDLEYFFDRINN